MGSGLLLRRTGRRQTAGNSAEFNHGIGPLCLRVSGAVAPSAPRGWRADSPDAARACGRQGGRQVAWALRW